VVYPYLYAPHTALVASLRALFSGGDNWPKRILWSRYSKGMSIDADVRGE